MKTRYAVPLEVPAHFNQYYQPLVGFLQGYYDWFERKTNMTPEERLRFEAGQTTLVRYNPDEYAATHQERLSGVQTDTMDISVSDFRAPGWFADKFLELTNLERLREQFQTSNVEIFCTVDGEDFEATYFHDDSVKNWLLDAGLPKDQPFAGDKVLFSRIITSLYQVKGQILAIELFFSLFFKETVTIINPQSLIAILDDNFILDGVELLSDDDIYQEFSLIVNTQHAPSFYEPLFTDIYLKMFHPAGFKITLIKTA